MKNNFSGSYEQICGRLDVIQGLISKRAFSLSIGSKETRLAGINVDVDPRAHPEIVADAKFLPFKEQMFSTVLFTDVIEHLPKSDETKALKEIYRVLCNRGNLILSTPNDKSLYTFLDLARYVMTHRHYKKERIQDLLESHGFHSEIMFTAGGFWAWLGNLYYCLIIYPIRKLGCVLIPNYRLSYTPSLIETKINREYKIATQDGYTIFIKARKIE